MSITHRLVVAYDIASDARREKVAELLSAHGPRVQLSVFEIELASVRDREVLMRRLVELIDDDEDQVRLYAAAADATIIGTRTLEERAAYWVLSSASADPVPKRTILAGRVQP